MHRSIYVRQPGSQTLKRGEEIDFPIELDRDNDDDSVVLRFEDLPSGLHAGEVRVHRGQSQASARFVADDDAVLVAVHEARVVAAAPGVEDSQPIRVSVTDEQGRTEPHAGGRVQRADPEGRQPREGLDIGGAQTKETEGRQAGPDKTA